MAHEVGQWRQTEPVYSEMASLWKRQSSIHFQSLCAGMMDVLYLHVLPVVLMLAFPFAEARDCSAEEVAGFDASTEH